MKLLIFFELDCYWDNFIYGDFLSEVGGKERLTYYINNFNPKLKEGLNESDIADSHNKKLRF